jgi:hypothetical protein
LAIRKTRPSQIEKFIALPDSEKARIVAAIEAESPKQCLARSRPLNARERRQWRRFKDGSPRRT